tara:strand:- start:294 stop:410 length:117 start_codon:yes stop_codon:yes gene_type:complete
MDQIVKWNWDWDEKEIEFVKDYEAIKGAQRSAKKFSEC